LERLEQRGVGVAVESPILNGPVSKTKPEFEYVELKKETLTDIEEECPICSEYFLDEKVIGTVVELPCKHRYHKNCILNWFDKSDTCPICREVVPKKRQ
jgi:hypothetical protein